MLDKQPELTLFGVVKSMIGAGPALPSGVSWHIVGEDETNIDRILRSFEGKEIQIDITILEEAPSEHRRMRTIRDLTEPR